MRRCVIIRRGIQSQALRESTLLAFEAAKDRSVIELPLEQSMVDVGGQRAMNYELLICLPMRPVQLGQPAFPR